MEITIGKPNSRQDEALKDNHLIIGYGGSRGGGKSWFLRTKCVLLCGRYPGIRTMIVRKTYPELIENHVKPLKELLHIGQPGCPIKYNDSKKEITFPNGSMIMLRYCANENDCDRYQGLEIDDLFLDESTQLPEIVIKKLMACVRGIKGYPRHVFLTCNPGGISHGYHKRIFIDRQYIDGENPNDYSFHEARVTDNYALMQSDPGYIKQLENLPESLKQAWLFGSWDVFEGCYYSEFREKPDITECAKHGISVEEAREDGRWTHVIEPFEIPHDWKIVRAYDWGYGKPFCMLYIGLPSRTAFGEEDTAYVIEEVYGVTKNANEGIKWSNEKQFDYFAELERTHPMLKGRHITGVADPSIWDGSHGISVADVADRRGIHFDKGINDRIPGWLQIRSRLQFNSEGYPRLYVFSNCKNLIRTFPLQMFDEHRVEDLDSSLEDHALDALRYFAMSRKVGALKKADDYAPISDPLNQYTRPKSIIRSY